MKTRWLRLATAIVAVGCTAVVRQIFELLEDAASPSGLMIGGIGVAAFGGTVAAILTFAPAHVLQKIVGRIQSAIEAVRSSPIIENRRLGRALMGIGIVAFLVIVSRLLWAPDDPSDDDQMAFLETAAAVHESGGPGRLIADLYGGRFAEANRHPLYIGLLSLRPTLAFGRGLSVVLGVATLLTLTLLTAHWRGTLVAGILCCLLGTNLAMGLFSTRVVCDVLMVLWGGLIFLIASRRDARRRWFDPPAIGGLLGLAYLTKGTGLLMLAGFLLWKFILWGMAIRRRKKDSLQGLQATGRTESASHQTWTTRLVSLSLVLVAWAAVASPLLVRNSRMYGKAFYNVNSWLLFVDAYEDPTPLPQQMTVKQAARAYWESHTPADIIEREVTGIVWESFMLLRLLGPYPLDDSRVLFGLALALCAAIGIIAAPRPEHGLLAVWTLLLTGVFAWYVPIAAGERFLLPLLAPMMICAGEGIVRLFSQLHSPPDHRGGTEERR